MGIFYSNTRMPTVRDLSPTFHCTTTCCNKFTGWWHSTAQQHAATSLQVGDIPPDNNMLQQVYRLVTFHLTTSCCNKFTGWWHSIWQQQVYNLVTFHLTTACSNKFTGWWHSTAQQHAETSLQVGDIPSDNNMLQQVYRLVKFHLTTTCSNI